jgi:hypothetical protein
MELVRCQLLLLRFGRNYGAGNGLLLLCCFEIRMETELEISLIWPPLAIVMVRLGLFIFLFGLVFAKLEQFYHNGFGLTCSHWLVVVLPLSPLYDAIHGWMTGRIDGWMEGFTKNDHEVLYYM